jgi:hypothetical protein
MAGHSRQGVWTVLNGVRIIGGQKCDDTVYFIFFSDNIGIC